MSDSNLNASNWWSVLVGKGLLACGFLIMFWNACIFLVDVFSDESVPQKDLTAFIGLALLGAGYAHVRIAKLEATVGKDSPDSES